MSHDLPPAGDKPTTTARLVLRAALFVALIAGALVAVVYFTSR